MGSRSLVALGLVAAAAAVAGWWLLREDAAPIAPVELAGSGDPTPSVAPPPSLAAGGAGGTGGTATGPPPTPPTFTGTAFLIGRVTRAGVPEAGVRVEARAHLEVWWGGLDPEGVRAAYRRVLEPPQVLPPVASVRSAADGTFRLEGLAEMTLFTVEARADDHAGARGFARATRDTSGPMKLDLVGASTLDVRCAWDDGAPMAGTVALRGGEAERSCARAAWVRSTPAGDADSTTS